MNTFHTRLSCSEFILQYVEFGGMDDEDAGHEPDNELGLSLLNPATKKTEENKPLEVLLASKNARITEELTRLRVCIKHLNMIKLLILFCS